MHSSLQESEEVTQSHTTEAYSNNTKNNDNNNNNNNILDRTQL